MKVTQEVTLVVDRAAFRGFLYQTQEMGHLYELFMDSYEDDQPERYAADRRRYGEVMDMVYKLIGKVNQ